ncbi:MAG: hypothetical protein WDW21_06255 [Neisseriaceae bacterium]
MKKHYFFLLFIFGSLTFSANEMNIINDFAKKEGLVLDSKDDSGNSLTYMYTCKSTKCTDFLIDFSPVKVCAFEVLNFGDLPLLLDGSRKAIFTMAKSRDYLRFLNSKRDKCVKISYGHVASKFDQMIELAKKL